MVSVSPYGRRIPSPSTLLAEKIKNFKRIYGAPAKTLNQAFFEILKEENLIALDMPVPTDEQLQKVSSELAEEFEEEMEKVIEKMEKKYPRRELAEEDKAWLEKISFERKSRLPKDIEDRLDGLEKSLERKRTEHGRRREISYIKKLIREYEKELGEDI